MVVAIIGLLASYVGPKYFAQLGKSEVTVSKAQIESLGKALDNFRLDVGRYPSTEEGLAALNTRPTTAPKWNGPYLLKDTPPDPWGRPYAYRLETVQGDFFLGSYGKDGRPGGVGENADITR